MHINGYLLVGLCFALLVIVYLVLKLWRVREQLAFIKDTLEDMKCGNLNRRVLARESDMTKQICYDINEIAIRSQSSLVQQRQADQAYRRLMTSLSHDVKTPLASLVGYLEAIESGFVTGQEKDEYIHIASDKAHRLKDFVTALFEWVKLDAGEQIFHFGQFDVHELARNIVADWIPILENNHFEYQFDIPETEIFIPVDPNAFTRVLNNLLQNVIIHSQGDKVSLCISENNEQVEIIVADNGKGISKEDIPHIFERMYQCDHSRASQGNGLGLAIVKELISIHKGKISVASNPGEGTIFSIVLPKSP